MVACQMPISLILRILLYQFYFEGLLSVTLSENLYGYMFQFQLLE
jgi:hypothetical protein